MGGCRRLLVVIHQLYLAPTNLSLPLRVIQTDQHQLPPEWAILTDLIPPGTVGSLRAGMVSGPCGTPCLAHMLSKCMYK